MTKPISKADTAREELSGQPCLSSKAAKPRKRRHQMTQVEFDEEHARLTLKRTCVNLLSAELADQWYALISDTEIVEE